MKIKLGLHENIVAISILTLTLVTLQLFNIIDYGAVWIFSPIWITTIGIISVYIVTSLIRTKPSFDEAGKYFNYCEFPLHHGIMSQRKSNWCNKKDCKYHKIYRESFSSFQKN